MARLSARAVIAAVLLFYVDLGAFIGFVVADPATAQPACWPRDSTFGLLDAHCATAVGGWLWFFAVGLPRTLIVFPAFAVAVIKAGFGNSGFANANILAAIPWIFYAIPLLLALWLAWAGRGRRMLPLLSMLTAILLAEVVHLAWRA